MILFLGLLPIKPFKFMGVYFFSGIVGNVAAVLFEEIAIMGASGAIIGVLGWVLLYLLFRFYPLKIEFLTMKNKQS